MQLGLIEFKSKCTNGLAATALKCLLLLCGLYFITEMFFRKDGKKKRSNLHGHSKANMNHRLAASVKADGELHFTVRWNSRGTWLRLDFRFGSAFLRPLSRPELESRHIIFVRVCIFFGM